MVSIGVRLGPDLSPALLDPITAEGEISGGIAKVLRLDNDTSG